MKTKIFTSLVLMCSFFTGSRAQCTANFQPVVSGCTVNFNNLSQGNSTQNWTWSFGDSQSGSTQNPSHTYAGPGTYMVCLQFNSPSCNASYCTGVTVNCVSTTGIAGFDKKDLTLDIQNPVPASAEVSYSIPASGHVEIAVFDMLGNKISVPENGSRSAGAHSFYLNSGSFSKGIYLLHMNFEGIVLTKKIIIQ